MDKYWAKTADHVKGNIGKYCFHTCCLGGRTARVGPTAAGTSPTAGGTEPLLWYRKCVTKTALAASFDRPIRLSHAQFDVSLSVRGLATDVLYLTKTINMADN